jgi:hypothetical protein
MEVLFVNDFKKPDYLNDMTYHGLKSLWNLSVSETSYPSYMMRDYPSKAKLYGRGFTLYASMKLDTHLEIEETIWQKINDKFYDLVVYGSIKRCSYLVDVVTRVYDKSKIVFLDGEDECVISRPDLVGKGHYFKRELLEPVENVQPVGFSIPSRHLVSVIPEKEKLMADVKVQAYRNYEYASETEYHAEYRRSYFGLTAKKAGWDCLRHYEILANGCVPLFENIDSCPPMVLTDFPKALLEKARNAFQPHMVPDQKQYADVVYALLQHTDRHCTTVAAARKLIERVTQ